MKVFPLKNEFVKMYSLGFEKSYKGTFIIYDDNSITFLFFYYKKHCRVYIIDGIKNNMNLVQVYEKINLIAVYRDYMCKRLVKFLKLKRKENDRFIFHINPLFYREIGNFLAKKNYLIYINYLYEKYREESRWQKII